MFHVIIHRSTFIDSIQSTPHESQALDIAKGYAGDAHPLVVVTKNDHPSEGFGETVAAFAYGKKVR